MGITNKEFETVMTTVGATREAVKDPYTSCFDINGFYFSHSGDSFVRTGLPGAKGENGSAYQKAMSKAEAAFSDSKRQHFQDGRIVSVKGLSTLLKNLGVRRNGDVNQLIDEVYGQLLSSPAINGKFTPPDQVSPNVAKLANQLVDLVMAHPFMGNEGLKKPSEYIDTLGLQVFENGVSVSNGDVEARRYTLPAGAIYEVSYGNISDKGITHIRYSEDTGRLDFSHKVAEGPASDYANTEMSVALTSGTEWEASSWLQKREATARSVKNIAAHMSEGTQQVRKNIVALMLNNGQLFQRG